MNDTHFVLPTVGTADMSKDDQGALIVNQATAVIVKAYLENWAQTWSVLAYDPNWVDVYKAPLLGFVDENALQQARRETIMTPDKLEALINMVQSALKAF